MTDYAVPIPTKRSIFVKSEDKAPSTSETTYSSESGTVWQYKTDRFIVKPFEYSGQEFKLIFTMKDYPVNLIGETTMNKNVSRVEHKIQFKYVVMISVSLLVFLVGGISLFGNFLYWTNSVYIMAGGVVLLLAVRDLIKSE